MASPAYVNSNNAYAGSSQVDVSLTGVTIGNLLVVWLNGRVTTAFALTSTAGTVNTKADGSGSAVWTKAREKLGTQDASGADGSMWWAYAQTSGTHTARGSGSGDMGAIILEYSGVIGSDPIDNSTDGIGTLTSGNSGIAYQTAFSVGAKTTVVAGFTEHQASTLYDALNSFVERQDNGSCTHWAGDLYCTNAASITPGVDAASAMSGQQWVGVSISIKGSDYGAVPDLSLFLARGIGVG